MRASVARRLIEAHLVAGRPEPGVRAALEKGGSVEARSRTRAEIYALSHSLSPRQVEMALAGGLIPGERQRATAG